MSSFLTPYVRLISVSTSAALVVALLFLATQYRRDKLYARSWLTAFGAAIYTYRALVFLFNTHQSDPALFAKYIRPSNALSDLFVIWIVVSLSLAISRTRNELRKRVEQELEMGREADGL